LKRVLSDAHLPNELPSQQINPTEGKVIWFVDNEAGRLL